MSTADGRVSEESVADVREMTLERRIRRESKTEAAVAELEKGTMVENVVGAERFL